MLKISSCVGLGFVAGLISANVIADAAHGSTMSNNPAINIVLEGRYASYDEEHFELEGFQSNGAHGIYEKGFSTGHNELNISSDLSEHTFGAASIAFEQDEGDTEVEIEEVYVSSSVLGNGLQFKVGKFFSSLSDLNLLHEHKQDFADLPLVYLGMFGGHLVDTGAQLSWKRAAGMDFEVGIELTSGASFPGGENEDNDAGTVLFAKVGSMLGEHSSWKVGLGLYSSEFDERTGGGHHDEGGLIIEEGEVDVLSLDASYSWAPNGKGNGGEVTVQFGYFEREEEGDMEYLEGTEEATADYDGEQSGYLLQAVYRINSAWRVGLRLDHLEADNRLNDFAVDAGGNAQTLSEESTGLLAEDDPERTSLMVDYAPNANSVIRLQFMNDESGHESDDRIYLQYVVAVGGAGH